MGKMERPARGRNIGKGALMTSPYAAEAIVHASTAVGVGATAAAITLGGGAVAYGVARYRDTPGKRARRDLRRASRAATTAGSPRRRVSNSRGGSSLGSKGRAKYATGAGRRSGHGGATSRRARSAAGHGGIGSKGRSSTALLDRKGKAPAGRGRAHAGSLGNRPGGRGGRSSRTPFGRGPRASAARQQAAARRGGRGGLGGLLGGGKAPKRNGNRRRGGLSAGLGLLSGRRGGKSGSRGHWNRRRTAAARAMQRQRGVGSGAKASKGKWSGSLGARTITASWRPLGRLLGRPRRLGFLPALTRSLHLFARLTWGLTGTAIGLVMFAPKAWQLNRSLGIAVARQINVWRSGIAAFLNPYSAEREAERIRGAVTNKPKIGTTSGGSAMSDVTADHIEALIEHIRNAQTIERFAGVHIAAHAEAMGRLAEALAEYAQANVDLIKEHTPTLDGGESLVQQADILAATGPALRECHEAFEVLHEDRLKRQRDPEHGEEHWDVAAAQE